MQGREGPRHGHRVVFGPVVIHPHRAQQRPLRRQPHPRGGEAGDVGGVAGGQLHRGQGGGGAGDIGRRRVDHRVARRHARVGVQDRAGDQVPRGDPGRQPVSEKGPPVVLVGDVEPADQLGLQARHRAVVAQRGDVLGAPGVLLVGARSAVAAERLGRRVAVEEGGQAARRALVQGRVLEVAVVDADPRVAGHGQRAGHVAEAGGEDVGVGAVDVGDQAEEVGARRAELAGRPGVEAPGRLQDDDAVVRDPIVVLVEVVEQERCRLVEAEAE